MWSKILCLFAITELYDNKCHLQLNITIQCHDILGVVSETFTESFTIKRIVDFLRLNCSYFVYKLLPCRPFRNT